MCVGTLVRREQPPAGGGRGARPANPQGLARAAAPRPRVVVRDRHGTIFPRRPGYVNRLRSARRAAGTGAFDSRGRAVHDGAGGDAMTAGRSTGAEAAGDRLLHHAARLRARRPGRRGHRRPARARAGPARRTCSPPCRAGSSRESLGPDFSLHRLEADVGLVQRGPLGGGPPGDRRAPARALPAGPRARRRAWRGRLRAARLPPRALRHLAARHRRGAGRRTPVRARRELHLGLDLPRLRRARAAAAAVRRDSSTAWSAAPICGCRPSRSACRGRGGAGRADQPPPARARAPRRGPRSASRRAARACWSPWAGSRTAASRSRPLLGAPGGGVRPGGRRPTAAAGRQRPAAAAPLRLLPPRPRRRRGRGGRQDRLQHPRRDLPLPGALRIRAPAGIPRVGGPRPLADSAGDAGCGSTRRPSPRGSGCGASPTCSPRPPAERFPDGARRGRAT